MISVCMATYNGSAFVEEQVRSILSELSAADELLIADDDSSDRTLEIIRSFADKRIRVLKPAGHLGAIRNFERILSQASGEIIFLSDQDDVWYPGKIFSCIRELEHCTLVVHDADILSQGKISSPTFFARRNSGQGLFKNIFKNSYVGCCMAFRRELLDFASPFPKHLPMHDQWLGLCAEHFGQVRFLPRSLISYRVHTGNATHSAVPGRNSIVQRIIWRWNLLWALAWRILCRSFPRRLAQRLPL